MVDKAHAWAETHTYLYPQVRCGMIHYLRVTYPSYPLTPAMEALMAKFLKEELF